MGKHSLHRIAMPLFVASASPFLGQPRLIAIFGTMRSGSTLLTEVLRNNPDIAGFGESHVQYRDRHSIGELRYWILWHTGQIDRKGRSLLDKILHHAHAPDPGVLAAHTDFWPIFLLRDPDGNGRSLAKMFQKHPGANDTDINALLMQRYAQLTEFLNAVDPDIPVAALSYQALTAAPDRVLSALTAHLELKIPLSKTYPVGRKTGRWGVGDGSEAIRSGRISASNATLPGEPSAFVASRELREAYARFAEVVRARAHLACLEP